MLAASLMRAFIPASLLICAAIFPIQAQLAAGEVRVSVVLNADGSRTVYQTDAGNHKCTATTTGTNGKVREKINYDLDDDGRFARGEVLGPKNELRFIALYKYDADNRLSEEVHLAKDESVVGKIVFHYDAAGHRTGYAAYDAAGKLLGQTARPSTSPSKRK